METVGSLLAISGALAVGVVSPGPSFLMVARTAVASSRRDGLMAALGMGAGGVMFAVAAVLGLQVVLTAVPALYAVLKIGGGAWLIYLGWRIWRGAAQPLMIDSESPAPRRFRSAFWLGLVTQVSNPKTALVYASVFAALLPQPVSWVVLLALPPLIFVIEAGWYALVALGLSSAVPRAAYLRGKTWIDRAAGVVLAALGLRSIASVR
jgi:threonine/homoserine/homoserine lactone efflux protein